jgi:hypothetical protein
MIITEHTSVGNTDWHGEILSHHPGELVDSPKDRMFGSVHDVAWVVEGKVVEGEIHFGDQFSYEKYLEGEFIPEWMEEYIIEE